MVSGKTTSCNERAVLDRRLVLCGLCAIRNRPLRRPSLLTGGALAESYQKRSKIRSVGEGVTRIALLRLHVRPHKCSD